MVIQLIKGGANVNHCGNDGKSALTLVDRNRLDHSYLTFELISNGAVESDDLR